MKINKVHIRHTCSLLTLAFCAKFSLIAAEGKGPWSQPIPPSANCPYSVDIVPSLPQFSVLCPGDLLTLTAIPFGGTEPYTYLWSNGETTQSISMTTPSFGAIFTVMVTDATGCVANDFAHLKYFEWTASISIDAGYFCQGQTANLYASLFPIPGNPSYSWSTGETTEFITISSNGTYTVTITDPDMPCPLITGTIDVTAFLNIPAPSPVITGPMSLCSGQSATLVAQGGPFASYVWAPTYGSETETLEIIEPGIYILYVQNFEGCQGTDTFEVLSEAPLPLLNNPPPICSGQSTLIEVLNASLFDTFDWNTGESSSSITVTEPGTYTVTVTTSGGCSASASVTIDASGSSIDLSATTIPVTSCTSPNGSVDLSVLPSGNYTFDWSNGEITEDIIDLNSGSYSVTVTDNGGCSAIGTYEVENNTSAPLSTAVTTPSTCNLPNGNINQTVTPPGAYTFIWSNGATTEDLSNVTALTYSVTVTSVSNGCTATASYTVPNINPPITITGNTVPYSSCISPNGAIDITPSPAGTYIYSWSNGAMTEDLANLAAGSYTLTVSAGGTCTQSATFTVTNTTAIPVLTATSSAATCGLNNGAIALSVMPAGTYTYLWSNGSMAEDLSAIPGDSYSVTVTSADGCTNSASILVDDSIVPLTITGITSSNTSCTSPNGAIDITINPTNTYSYLWSNGAMTEDLTIIPSGTYTITATLGLTCMSSSSFVVEDNPAVILLSGTTTPNTSCSMPNGAIDLSISTPGVYMYIWSNGQTTEDIEQLTGGTYTVTVTAEDGCTNTAAFDISNTNSTFTFTGTVLPNTSCSSPSGSIDVTVSPAGAYTFSWSTGASSEDLQNLTSGTYGITVSDLNNCSSVASFSVSDALSFPTASAIFSPATCNGNNGAIDLSVTPAVGNSFSWSNGNSTEDITNLAPGDYSLTITGANGCVFSDTFSVINLNSTFSITGTSVANSSCLNPNGAIDLSVSPASTYTFMWSNAAITEDLSNLSSGSYIVTVTDLLNCTALDTFTVLNNTTSPVLSATITPAICGADNGAIDLMVILSNNNAYQWSNGSMTEDQLNIPPGTYSVIVTDANGCKALDTFNVPNINNNFSVTAMPVANTSCSSPNGSIDLTISPFGTYTYLWSNGAITEDIVNLGPGSYSVTISDITSCSSSEMYVIGNNTPVITITSDISPALCGTANGNIDLTINPSAGNFFIWSNGAVTEDVQDLAPGEYSVTVTGTGGCTTIDTFDVYVQGLAITLQGMTTANTSCSSSNGSIDLSVTPNGAYSYQWSSGNTTQDMGNLDPGTYTVTVSDVNGCSSSASFTIDDQPITPVIQSTITPSNCGNTDGQIELTILPIGTYLFSWSNGATSEDLTTLIPGMYAVTVTGQGGCTTDTTLEVTNSGLAFTLSATITGNTDCTGSNGSIEITLSPSGTYTYAWSNGDITEDLQNISAGTYTVSVTDQSGCSTANQYTVDQNVTPLMVEDVTTPVLCGEPNGAIDLTVRPETGNTFLWSNGSVTEDLVDILPGQYAVTITGQNGCIWSSAFQVDGSLPLQINLEANAAQTGAGYLTITATLNVSLQSIDTIIWLPAELFDCTSAWCLEQTIPRPDSRTEIKVIAVDTNGCMAQGALFLETIAAPEVYIPNVFSPNGDGINDRFTIYGNPDVEIIEEMQIFDRWGNQVFIATEFPPNNENYGWDGGFRNEPMNPAVFVYWARVRYTDGNTGSLKGDITLVR